MASEVDICNLALGHLGDNATVASLDPPEGSAQAEHCARFYPLARDALLEMHDWNFATRRATLAEVTMDWTQWQYAYVQPADCLKVIAVHYPTSTDDYSQPLVTPATLENVPELGQGIYTPQPFVCETDDEGRNLIYTNVEDAIVRYIALVSDTTKFSPLFTIALTWHLAAMLAGPIIKGEAGRAEALRCQQMANGYLSRAMGSDSRQRMTRTTHNVSWIAGR